MSEWSLPHYAICKTLLENGGKIENPLTYDKISSEAKQWIREEELNGELKIAVNYNYVGVKEIEGRVFFVLNGSGEEFVGFTEKRLEEINQKNREFAEGLKSKSGSQDEIVWSDTQRKIHPVMDVWNGKFLTTQNFKFKFGNDVFELPAAITSDREIFRLNANPPFDARLMPSGIINRWSNEGMKDFIEGIYAHVELADVFSKIDKQFRKYVDLSFEDRYYALISFWIINTYFHELFNSLGYLFFNGVKRSGKTKTQEIIGQLSFNSESAISPSEASLKAATEFLKSTLIMDEMEGIYKRENRGYINELLKSGNRKMFSVLRVKGDNKTGWEIVRNKNYGPKTISNIEGIEDVLQDRCITITMDRTGNKIIGNKLVGEIDKTWQFIRDDLYYCMMTNWKELLFLYHVFYNYFSEKTEGKVEDIKKAMERASEYINETYFLSMDNVDNDVDDDDVRVAGVGVNVANKEKNPNSDNSVDNDVDVYNKIDSNFIKNQNTHPPNTYIIDTYIISFIKKIHLSDQEEISNLILLLEKTKDVVMSRDFEMWLPIYAIAYLTHPSFLKEMVELSIDSTKTKELQDSLVSKEMSLIAVLLDIVKEDGYYHASQIAETFKRMEGVSDNSPKWMNSKWVLKILKKMKIITPKDQKRTADGYVAFISKRNVEIIAKKFKLISESEATTSTGADPHPHTSAPASPENGLKAVSTPLSDKREPSQVIDGVQLADFLKSAEKEVEKESRVVDSSRKVGLASSETDAHIDVHGAEKEVDVSRDIKVALTKHQGGDREGATPTLESSLPSETPKCYRCQSQAIQQIPDDISGQLLWICKKCLEEFADAKQ